MKNFFIIAILIVGVVGAFVFFGDGEIDSGGNATPTAPQNSLPAQQNDTQTQKQSRKAPAFSFKDYNGNTVSLSDFAGKPVLLNSWAAWCPFCRKELPDFAAIQKEFGDSIVIVAIDRAESLAVSKKYSDELGVTDDLIFLLDPKDSFYRDIGGFSMPETLFVDGDGNIIQHKRGPMDVNEIRRRVKEAFNI